MHVLSACVSLVVSAQRASKQPSFTRQISTRGQYAGPLAIATRHSVGPSRRMEKAVSVAVAEGIDKALAERTFRFLKRGADEWTELARRPAQLVSLLNDTVARNAHLAGETINLISDDEEEEEPPRKRSREAPPPAAASADAGAAAAAAAPAGGIDFKALVRAQN